MKYLVIFFFLGNLSQVIAQKEGVESDQNIYCLSYNLEGEISRSLIKVVGIPLDETYENVYNKYGRPIKMDTYINEGDKEENILLDYGTIKFLFKGKKLVNFEVSHSGIIVEPFNLRVGLNVSMCQYLYDLFKIEREFQTDENFIVIGIQVNDKTVKGEEGLFYKFSWAGTLISITYWTD